MSAALQAAPIELPVPAWELRERQAVTLDFMTIPKVLNLMPDKLGVDQVKYNPTNLHPVVDDMLATASGHLLVRPEHGDDGSSLSRDAITKAIIHSGMTAHGHFRFPNRWIDWGVVAYGQLETPHPERSLRGLELVICIGYQGCDADTVTFDATVFAQCPIDTPVEQKEGPYVAFKSYGNVVRLTPKPGDM